MQTTYQLTNKIQLIHNEEYKEHICLVELRGINGEPCSGILKHWGSKDELIEELKEVLAELYNVNLK